MWRAFSHGAHPMGLYSAFKTDNNLERQGRWFDLKVAPNKDGSIPGFKMARMHKNNPEYLAAVERVSKDLRQAVDLDLVNEEVASPIMRTVFVETILLDWRNVYLNDDDDAAIVFDKAAADKLMTDLPDLYMLLADEARKLGNFRQQEVEAVAKKSAQLSNTPSGSSAT